MNMNVKLGGEEEQSGHYPNRATISLQSGTAAYINLNIVNQNLGNQGYILNPVNPVPQNLVAYQSPVTLQSYITLQEADGNLVNNLQVGVPVPIGLPVPAELLQNPNLVNTSIIIGNEDCNQPVIFKPTTNNVSETNDIKISYVPKPVLHEIKSTSQEDSNIRLNDINALNMDNVLKKPCPLEMSIKAANIDLEFEKCDTDDLVQETNGMLLTRNYPIIEKLPISDPISDNMVLNVPMKIGEEEIIDVPVIQQKVIKPKTEITWESNVLQDQSATNEFQESLICEVEEAYEDDDEKYNEREENSTLEENKTQPLSVVLKLRRVEKENDEDDKSKFRDEMGDMLKATCRRSTKDCTQVTFCSKQEPNKCNKFQEPVDANWESKKFLKVRHCCSKKECFKKISLKDQKKAHKNFYDLDSPSKQDSYLISCLEHVQICGGSERFIENIEKESSDIGETDEKSLLDTANMQLEIENESKGNQLLSDEIQKAIKESLKDCLENQVKKESDAELEENKKTMDEETKNCSNEDEDEKIQNWNYYIVIDNSKKRVCLQFLLKLFRITKNRIKALQRKISSGQSVFHSSPALIGNETSCDVWDLAKIHLRSQPIVEHPFCRANPCHRYLNNKLSAEDLFEKFKDFYVERIGKEAKIKLSAYKRFLVKDANVIVSQNKQDFCPECCLLEEQGKNKKTRDKNAIQNNITRLNRSFQSRKKGRKKWESSTDTDCSSEEEPLSKRKKLKLKISLKGNKMRSPDLADSNKKARKKTGKDVKSRGNNVKGRDVWSLMLLHLETMPYKVCKNCNSRKRHRFFDASMTTQTLYEDYRRYFLKETNSELGLGFTMYEKYFDRNCGFTIGDVDVDSPVCPRCALEPPKPESIKSNRKGSKNNNNNLRLSRQLDILCSNQKSHSI